MRRPAFLVANFVLCLGLAHVALSAAPGADEAPSSATPSQPAPSSLGTPQDIPSLPPEFSMPPGMVDDVEPTLSPTVAAPVVSGEGYWIVSSRQCRDRSPGHLGCMRFYYRSSDKDLQNLGQQAFCTSLDPRQPVCFVIHGSYNWWRDVLNESRKIHRWIHAAAPGTPVQIVFFTWPSDGNLPFVFPVDIARLGRKASLHSVYLAQLMTQLPPEQPVCLLGHSHGARAAVAAMHLLGGGAVEDGQRLAPGYSTPQHLRAVLVAAAIDHNWLNPGQRYDRALLAPEQVLLLRNSRDATLAIYPLRKGYSERAIGRNGLGRDDRLAIDAMAKKIVELDAAEFAGPNHSFADYHQRPELASAIVPYVYFADDSGPGMPAAAGLTSAPTSPQSTDPVLPTTTARPPRAPAAPRNAVNGPSLGGTTTADPFDGPAAAESNDTPAKLAPIADDEIPALTVDPQASLDRDRPVKIMPRARPAAHLTNVDSGERDAVQAARDESAPGEGRILKIMPRARPAGLTDANRADRQAVPAIGDEPAGSGERVLKIMPRARPAAATVPPMPENEGPDGKGVAAPDSGERVMRIMPRARPAAEAERQPAAAARVEPASPPKKKRSPFLLD